MNTYTVLTTPTLSVKVHADKFEVGEVIKFYKDKELVASFPNSCSVFPNPAPNLVSSPAPEDKGKKIEFKYSVLNRIGKAGIGDAVTSPVSYRNIELIKRASSAGYYDLMLAYNDYRLSGTLYLGHYNDGIK